MKRIKLDNSILGVLSNTEEPENENFEWEQEEQIDFDGEKGFVTYSVIYKRLSDDLYFQVDVVDMAHHGGVECSSDLEQVFPKQITTTIYE